MELEPAQTVPIAGTRSEAVTCHDRDRMDPAVGPLRSLLRAQRVDDADAEGRGLPCGVSLGLRHFAEVIFCLGCDPSPAWWIVAGTGRYGDLCGSRARKLQCHQKGRWASRGQDQD